MLLNGQCQCINSWEVQYACTALFWICLRFPYPHESPFQQKAGEAHSRLSHCLMAEPTYSINQLMYPRLHTKGKCWYNCRWPNVFPKLHP